MWTVGVTHKHNALSNLTEEPPPELVIAPGTMRLVECDDSKCIVKCFLSLRKGYSVF
jgi:hypothetical protein